MCIRDRHRAVPANTLTTVCQGVTSVRALTTTVESFCNVQQFLTTAAVPFHTFALLEERELKGIPGDVPTNRISAQLNRLGYLINIVTPFISPGKRVASNDFPCEAEKGRRLPQHVQPRLIT